MKARNAVYDDWDLQSVLDWREGRVPAGWLDREGDDERGMVRGGW